MLFSEIYGSYFAAVSEILSLAVDGKLTGKALTETVQRQAFGESMLTIPGSLKDGSWALLRDDFSTPIKNHPQMPVTTLQKQWLKALLSEPRIRLFAPSMEGLEDVEPLYEPGTFVYFDRYTDGDPYEDENYIEIFHSILQAIREKRRLRIRYHGHRNTRHCYDCIPYKLEYSAKDDKFRMISAQRGDRLTVNLSRIRSVKLLEPWDEADFRPANYREKSLVMELYDERNALERAMLHFSDLEKETVKLSDKHYRITVWYRQDDETEILIRILSFGPVLKVLEPESMVQQIRERIERQFRLQQTT